MDWYKRYIGDYQRDTAELSPLQHGMYGMLLDNYYAKELPLVDDLDVLCRLCRAHSKAERAAVRSVLEAFFPIGEDGKRHNSRADSEIEKALAAHKELSERGKKGVEAKRLKNQGHESTTACTSALSPSSTSADENSTSATTSALPRARVPDSRLQTKTQSSVPPERLNPGPRHAASLVPGQNGKKTHRARVEEPESERVRKALLLLERDPSCTVGDAARMLHVSVEAIETARAPG